VTSTDGSWAVQMVDGADVRLRSGKIGLVNVDVSAPVSGGELHFRGEIVEFSLLLALDQLRTGNFLVQAAARTLVTRHDAHVLSYAGTGPSSDGPWIVTGNAVAGNVDVEIVLTVTAVGTSHPLDEIEIAGSASFGTVHLPLPGMGTVDDFMVDLDAKLALAPRH